METQTPPDISVFIPVRTRTPGNTRRHWRVDAREAREQRQAAYYALFAVKKKLPTFPVRVLFTRYGKREIDVTNIPGNCKHVQDGLADVYGVDDRDKRWTFEFDQFVGKEYGVRIDIWRK